MSIRLPIVLVPVALALLAGTAQGMDPKWPAGPYKYMVIDQDIKDVLAEFGRNIDVPVDVSDQVKGRLRGRMPAESAEQFLTKLCDSYGLVWYFDGAVLHVNAKTEVKTELMNIGRLAARELTDRLNALGIADARFAVRSTPDAGVVSVSGPPPFLSMVRQTLTTMARTAPPAVREDSHGDEIRVRVFRGSSTTRSMPATPG